MKKTARKSALIAIAIGCILAGTVAITVFLAGRNENVRQAIAMATALRPMAFAQNLEDAQYLLFSEDSKRLFAMSGNGRITVYESGTWRKLKQWKAGNGQIFVSRDGHRLVLVENSYPSPITTISTWDANTGARLHKWSFTDSREVNALNPATVRMFSSISNNLQRIVLVHYKITKGPKGYPLYEPQQCSIVDAATGEVQAHLPGIKIKSMGVETFWLEQDRLLLLAGRQSSPHLFNTGNWTPVAPLPLAESATLSSDGTTLVGVRNDLKRSRTARPGQKPTAKRKSSVVLYHLQTRQKQKISTDFDYVRWAYLQSEALIISGARDKEQEKGTSHESFVQVRSPDGTQIRTEFKYDLLKTGAQKRLLALEALETLNNRQKIYAIHRAIDGKLLCRLNANTDPLNGNWERFDWTRMESQAFSPDGKWFVSGNDSGLLRFWQLPKFE